MQKHINIFYVYAQEDRPLRDKLEQHLSILQQEKIITSWSDRCILPGKTWANEISTRLEQADIILLLVSAAFLSSKYCYSVEMTRALEKEKNGSAHVIPVILRHIDWQGAPFSHLQALPTLARPVVGGGWRSQDEAFTDIAKGIRKVVEKLLSRSDDVVRRSGRVFGTESSVENIHEEGSLKQQKLNLRTDILLVTVTAIEAQAVLHLFAKETGQKFERHFINDKTYFNLGVLNGVRIMMVQSEMGASGPGGALLVVDEGIRMLSPSAVIMVGIAFGIDSDKQQIGDILVSQQLLGYELQRIATSNKGKIEIIPRGDRSHASTMLLDRFRGGMLDWHESKVECGLILSGDKLIDQQDFRDQLRKLAPEAIGGEMEGTGLYSAAQRRKVDWILVKAICEWANGNKEQKKDQNKKVAAENAVRFTLHVLKLGGFVPGISTSSSNGGRFISETNSTEAGTAVSSDSGATPFEHNNVGATTINKQSSSPPLECGTLLRKYDVHVSWVVAVAWEPDGMLEQASHSGPIVVILIGSTKPMSRLVYTQLRGIQKENLLFLPMALMSTFGMRKRG
jgi:nucleoside phosphorylase